jgi:predicted nucleic acid-binding Zn ribbon protein
MRYNNSKPIKDVINNYLKAFKLDDKMNEVRLHEHWEKLMGMSISKHTLKIEIKKKKLYIFLDSSVLRSELSYAKQKIVESINTEFGQQLIDEVILM